MTAIATPVQMEARVLMVYWITIAFVLLDTTTHFAKTVWSQLLLTVGCTRSQFVHFQKSMNVRAPHVPMVGLVWTKWTNTTAFALLDTITHIAKMVTFFCTLCLRHRLIILFSEIDECESSPCSNGGQCTNLVAGYHCTCPPGYNYTHCQNGIFKCVSMFD